MTVPGATGCEPAVDVPEGLLTLLPLVAHLGSRSLEIRVDRLETQRSDERRRVVDGDFEMDVAFGRRA